MRLGSGIDTVIYELASRLSKNNNVTVFCFKTDYAQENCSFEINEIKSSFANTTKRMMMLAPFVLDKIGTLQTELKKFDVLNTHHYPANYITRNFKGPIKLVTEWSAVKPSMFTSLQEKLYIQWGTHANKVAAKKADVVLAPCDFVKNWIRQNYSLDSTMMFLDGVNFEIFDRYGVKPDKVYQLHPSLIGKKIILFVGRIAESKNIHSLIDIFYTVQKKIPDLMLVLVGDYKSYYNYYLKLMQIIKTKNLDNKVIFTGIVPWEDLPAYYAACTIYATCSLWEGFLRAESFAFGKPIVCFNTGANQETVKDNETGFLIQDLNVAMFAERMHELLINDDLSKNLGESGYRWAKENLDFDKISERFDKFCRQILPLN
jgi:1,2-diacylglycerol 3-alpha-glucosyltransferase